MRRRWALLPPREVYLPALAETWVLVVCWRSLLQGFGSVPLPPFIEEQTGVLLGIYCPPYSPHNLYW